jgi:hypothetical protein
MPFSIQNHNVFILINDFETLAMYISQGLIILLKLSKVIRSLLVINLIINGNFIINNKIQLIL